MFQKRLKHHIISPIPTSQVKMSRLEEQYTKRMCQRGFEAPSQEGPGCSP